MFSLKGKNIVLTGAAGILGSEFSRILLNHGARLIGVDNRENPESIRDIKNKNFNYYCFDITQKEEWVKLRDKENISVDVLINGAAIKSENFFELFENFSLKEREEVMKVNITGSMLACQTFGPLMAKRNSGSIINFLSIYGIVGPDQCTYDGSYYLGKESFLHQMLFHT